MDITLKIAGNEDKEEWNKLVENSHNGTVFHTWDWLKIAEKHTNSKLYPLIGYINVKPSCLIPLFYRKRFLIKTLFSPPPKTGIPYLGPLFLDYDKLKQYKKESVYSSFHNEVENFIYSKIRSDFTLISLSPGIIDTRPYKWSEYTVEPTYSYLLDLTEGKEIIWSNFKKRLKQDIRRTERKGIMIKEGSKEELLNIYDLLSEVYEKQNKAIPISKKYLIDVFDCFFPKNLRIFFAEYNGDFIGGVIDVYYKSKVASWVGNPKSQIPKLAVNDLINWKAIEWACDHGFEAYEIIGANTHRLSSFKTKYNPELSVYFTAKKYSSPLIKYPELFYKEILKPIKGRMGVR